MLEKCQSAHERWGGVSSIIDHWLDDRQKLISKFVSLPSVEVREIEGKIESFCTTMMDYLSSGHFEVYEQLLHEGSEFNDGSLEEAQKIFPRIQPTTDAALDFNDNFASLKNPTVQQIREFSFQLSTLGENLEERFALEDQLIEILHTAHRDTVMVGA
ncbi:Rsd/AlgQ family anti-sigma factor [Neptunomonas antarctica]|uniref:Regulator of sigma D n=1 Tax=Neptunomonas antarctica TaxID=619304 RepID=A0A1N7MLV8_9GAMM|nr:Rsd/AlgQ family anti-sigma factor [Neptunomonas antarctica]SIS86988.1 regulator of sigma D [Neptunomonas antarctica]